jgi:hypothetical protein
MRCAIKRAIKLTKLPRFRLNEPRNDKGLREEAFEINDLRQIILVGRAGVEPTTNGLKV